MNFATLIQRGLRFYWRTNLGVAAGTAVATAVLVGALLVGDSVRGTLRDLAMSRVGEVSTAVESRERLFDAALAARLEKRLDVPTAAVLHLGGVASRPDGTARANEVQVLGVDAAFWRLGGADDPLAGAGPGKAAINRPLARRLGANVGERITLRVERVGALPSDAPLAPADTGAAMLLEVAAVVDAGQFGNFSLRAEQAPPLSIMLPRAALAERIDRAGRANVLLAGGADAGPSRDDAQAALEETWTLADVGLNVAPVEGRDVVELTDERVLVDRPVSQAARNLDPAGTRIFTYLVNELRVGERATPYSMVAAVADEAGLMGFLPSDLADDEVVINDWLARDLDASVGDELTMRYFVLAVGGELRERSRAFTIRRIVPISGRADDPTLMPEFPGVAGVEDCRDWDPGMPVDLDRIRPSDEQYWDDHRGTPKAFVSLTAGREMWANRFGDLTAVRWARGDAAAGRIAGELRSRLDPAELGLKFRAARREALVASREAQNLASLFAGLSFFLIVAALTLTTLLFVLAVDQRTDEIGALLAMGLRRGQVRRAMLGEGACLAVIGAVVGLVGGIAYTRAMLAGLSGLWSGAVAGARIRFHASTGSLVLGAVAAVVVALLAMWFILRRRTTRPARELLTGTTEGQDTDARWRLRWKPASGLGVAALAAAVGLGVLSPGGQRAAAVFFLVGALLLAGMLLMVGSALARLSQGPGRSRLTRTGLMWRNLTRRRGRSLAVIGILASASFLIVAVTANRKPAPADPMHAVGSTGGFTLMARSTLPVEENLATAEGRRKFGLSGELAREITIAALRVRGGDEASCLNLNRPQQPVLWGLPSDASAFGGRVGFEFAAERLGADRRWGLLGDDLGPDVIAAVGDAATVTWALGKSVGDELEYVDERGETFRVRIVATLAHSILQGGLIVAEDRLLKRYPSIGGYRMFLVRSPHGQTDAAAAALSRAGADVGMEVVRTERLLARYNAVQNTYLAIFQALGGLGLLLGTAGVGVVVARNVAERRSELALLQAVGFTRGELRRLVVIEHCLLVGAGLAVGLLAGAAAVAPVTGVGESSAVWLPGGVLAAVAAAGMLWTWVAGSLSMRGSLVGALRNE